MVPGMTIGMTSDCLDATGWHTTRRRSASMWKSAIQGSRAT